MSPDNVLAPPIQNQPQRARNDVQRLFDMLTIQKPGTERRTQQRPVEVYAQYPGFVAYFCEPRRAPLIFSGYGIHLLDPDPDLPDLSALHEAVTQAASRFLKEGGKTSNLLEACEAAARKQARQPANGAVTGDQAGFTPDSDNGGSVDPGKTAPRTILARFEGHVIRVRGDRVELELLAEEGDRFRVLKPVASLRDAGIPLLEDQAFDYRIEELDSLSVSREVFEPKHPQGLSRDHIQRVIDATEREFCDLE